MLNNTLSKVVYVADGIQKQWDIPFEFYKIEDVHIYITSDGEHIEEIDQNYYYDEEGKFFIYPTEESELDPIPAGTQVLILRETENTQLEDSSEIYFKSKDIERGLDNLTMQVQDLKRDSLRAVKLSHFATQTPEDFTKGIFEAEKRATEAAAKAATSESNASLSEQNAASDASSAQAASATAAAAAQLAESLKSETEEFAKRSENAASDASASASQASESAHMASDLLQEVTNSIYNKDQVDAKISGLQAEIDTVESSIPSVREEFNQGLSELQTQITAQDSAIAEKQDKLVAGSNITINGNVISATGGGGGGGSAGSADIAKAIENQNKASDTIDPIYNWLGTQQEYEEQNIAQEHPDWVCFITDDVGEQGGGGESGTSNYALLTNKPQINSVELDGNKTSTELGLASKEEFDTLSNTVVANGSTLAALNKTVTNLSANKQDKLVAGDGITIEGNVISSTATGSGGSVEIPDNVYTQENLLGGKKIEIVPEPVEGGIDEHTLAYWPFDGSEYDEVSGARAYDAYFYNTNPVPAVGTNCASSLSGCSVALSDLTSDWTIDGYLYGNSTFNFAWTLGKGTYSSNTTYITGPSLRIISSGVYLRNTYPSNPIEYADSTLINSGWIHLALQRKKDLLQAFVNGKKILETNVASDKMSGDLLFRPINNAEGHRIDNVRFSNVARYNGDFTPPTEPYTRAEPTGNKVINFTGTIPSKTSELENNSGFLTQSNLLGGKDIEIIPEPVEGGIDEHTIGMWHFDGDKTDVISGQTISGSNSSDNYKFGTAGLYRNYTSAVMSFSGDTGTIDFWYLKNGTYNLDISFNGTVTSSTPLGWLFRLDPASNVIQFGFRSSSGFSWNPIVEKPYNFSNTDFIHVAAQRLNSNNYNLFINGSLFVEGTATDNTGWGKILVSSDGCFIDELRVSDVVRYDRDFTPPTQPYRKAEPTGNYVINFTGKESSSSGASKNIGEVYYSQSSLATDNAGALPLFTGETIVSANTIYPDFCKWVGEHYSELCCSGSEYEAALTTYGECPKYSFLIGSITAWDFSKTANPSALSGVNFQDGLTAYTKGTPWDSLSKGSFKNVYADKECTVYLSDSNGIFHFSTSGDGYYNLYQGVDTVFYECKFQKGDGEFVKTNLRLPKLSNYIKMANITEGITQKEAGLPNITGSTSYNNGSTGMWLANNTNIYQGAFVKQGTGSGYLTGGSGTGEILGFDASLSSEVYGKSETVTPAHTTLYPWVYTFSAAIPASIAQAAEFQQGLSGKADTNLGNIPTNYDYVVESYSDEEGNWYRVYKSGWLEQGGTFTTTSTTTSTSYKVNLLKPMSNSFYYVSVRPVGHISYFGDDWTVVGERTTTTFNTSTPSGGCVWYVCGQGA